MDFNSVGIGGQDEPKIIFFKSKMKSRSEAHKVLFGHLYVMEKLIFMNKYDIFSILIFLKKTNTFLKEKDSGMGSRGLYAGLV